MCGHLLLTCKLYSNISECVLDYTGILSVIKCIYFKYLLKYVRSHMTDSGEENFSGAFQIIRIGFKFGKNGGLLHLFDLKIIN